MAGVRQSRNLAKTALRNNAEGRAANDRLDTAMRLFSYASGGESNGVTAAHTIDAFIEQVRALAIEADSWRTPRRSIRP